MRRNVSVLFARLAAVTGAIACSNPGAMESPAAVAELPASFTQALSAGPRVYVLDRIDQQTSSPIVTFDHVCGATHVVTLLYDTLTLWPNGDARRSFAILRARDGVVTNNDPMVATGRWSRFTKTFYYYYSDGPSIEVALTSDTNGRVPAYVWDLRIQDGGAALTTFSGVGGSCPGSPNDGHQAIATFSLH
jgi:hypothetical protein